MRITKERFLKLINEAQLSEADETGGATTSTLKKGLAIAFPDWAGDIEGMDLKSSFVDEFASMIGNAMKAAESGDLVKAATASDKSAAALEGFIREEAAKSTEKYDDDSALTGDQDELPDELQKGIIDKTVEDREEDKIEEILRLVREAGEWDTD